jgi:hypothetical protein
MREHNAGGRRVFVESVVLRETLESEFLGGPFRSRVDQYRARNAKWGELTARRRGDARCGMRSGEIVHLALVMVKDRGDGARDERHRGAANGDHVRRGERGSNDDCYLGMEQGGVREGDGGGKD